VALQYSKIPLLKVIVGQGVSPEYFTLQTYFKTATMPLGHRKLSHTSAETERWKQETWLGAIVFYAGSGQQM